MSLLEDGHVYSYSQLSSFDECPYSFYLERIERDADGKRLPQEPNAFAEHGTLIHDIIDKWAKGVISKDEMTLEYDLRFDDEVPTPFPRIMKNYREKAYQLGYDYFASFDCFEGLEIISSETHFETEIAGRKLVGFIDMIARDKETGELIVIDHKSKSLKAFKQAEDEMYRQQLLYSKYIFEHFGVYPDRLMFNLFKEMGKRMERRFKIEDYENVLRWAEETIERIEAFEVLDYLDTKPKDFFCENICSVRKFCANGQSN